MGRSCGLLALNESAGLDWISFVDLDATRIDRLKIGVEVAGLRIGLGQGFDREHALVDIDP